MDEIKKKLSKDARSVIDAFEKQKNIYEVIRTISKKYDLLSDYMNSIEFIINGCKIIYEDSDSLAILRFLHQYISYSYLVYDSKSLKHEHKLKKFMNHEENLIEKHFEDKKLSKRIESYLKEAYEKKVNKPEAQQYETLRLYFCEQMLNFCTAKYLTKKIIETGLHKDMEILKKEILPSIVYIFMMPNLFSRKIYVNAIINMYSEGKLYNTNPFHRQSKFDPMGGVDINTGAAPIKEISCIVKQFLLHQSLTYTVIYEACFYGNLKAYFDNDKQKLCAFIKNEIEKDVDSYTISNQFNYDGSEINSDMFRKDEDDVFIKIYEAIRRYLFNNIMLKRWKKGQDLDYKTNQKSRFKMMISLLEYEKTNIFMPGEREYFNIDNYK